MLLYNVGEQSSRICSSYVTDTSYSLNNFPLFPLHHVISFLSPQQLQPYPLGFLGRSPCFWCLRHSSEFLPMTFRSINFQCCKNTPWTMLGLWVLLPQHPVSLFSHDSLGGTSSPQLAPYLQGPLREAFPPCSGLA